MRRRPWTSIEPARRSRSASTDRASGLTRHGVRPRLGGASPTDVMLAVTWKTARLVVHYCAWAGAEREAVSLLSYDYSLDCDRR